MSSLSPVEGQGRGTAGNRDGGEVQGTPADRFRIKKSIVSGDPPVE